MIKNIFFFLFLSQLLISKNVFSLAAPPSYIANDPSRQIYKKLGQKIDLNLEFSEQNGEKKKLKEFLKNKKALILTLNYYRCTTMCTYQFLNMSSLLKGLNPPLGEGYSVASVSFDPTDTVQKAKQTRDIWALKMGNAQARWDFLVGDQKNIEALTQELNFYYEKDDQGNYSHAGALFFIGDDGTFERYLYGIVYDKSDVELALYQTSHGALGSVFDKILSVFKKYDPVRGRYISFFSGE